jgi:hypothetical protein
LTIGEGTWLRVLFKDNYILVDYSDDVLEKRWQKYLEREASFHRPLQASDEKVIQCW